MAERCFFKNLKVQFKGGESNHCGTVRITIEIRTIPSPVHHKNLIVRITDDFDPLFLYNLSLSEEDFQNLKSQQNLLINFNDFPQNLVKLLQDCINQEDEANPEFFLEFWKREATLKIIQINKFSRLQHLALKLAFADDNELKKYLATCLNSIRDKNKDEQNRNMTLKGELVETKGMLKKKAAELAESHNEKSKLISLHRQELNVEKKKHLDIQEEVQKRHEREKLDIQTRFQMKINQMENQLQEQKKHNELIEVSNRDKSSDVVDLKRQLDELTVKYRKAKDDVECLREENQDYKRAHKDVSDKCSQLKQNLCIQEKQLSRMASSLKYAKTQRAKSDRSNVELDKLVQDYENKMKVMSQDAQKADEVILKFKNELKSYIRQLDMQKEVGLRQEKILETKEKLIEEGKHQLQEKTRTLFDVERELANTKELAASKTLKLAETAELLKSNERLIEYLNRQINDMKISSRPPAKSYNAHHQHHAYSLQNDQKQQPYSTPVCSYQMPAQNLGVSTINTSPRLSSSHVKSNSDKLSTVASLRLSSSSKDKENDGPSHLAISPEYFVKSNDESLHDLKQPVSVPGAINLKNFQRNSSEMLRPLNNASAQNNIAVSAYFSGKIAKPQ